MVVSVGVITGRDALHRLDEAVNRQRADVDTAMRAVEDHGGRRAQIAQLRAQGFAALAKMRLDELKEGASAELSGAELQAMDLLKRHAAYVEEVRAKVDAAAAEVAALDAARREAEQVADAASAAFARQAAATEARLQTDAGYRALKDAFSEAQAVVVRAAQKQEIAKADRAEKGAPYEADPLFAYLWKRRFRTPDYRGAGLTRMLDGWVARLCGYDGAWLNYTRLVELPDRLAEHAEAVKAEVAASQAALERAEADALKADGGDALRAASEAARARLADLDAKLAAAEKALNDARAEQSGAVAGDSGPAVDARRLIEQRLTSASFPDLKVLAAQTTTLDDDRIVDQLIRLRTEELTMDLDAPAVRALPDRRRDLLDALETVRRRFKEQQLDSPWVSVNGPQFETALDAYARGEPDAEGLWRAVVSAVHRAPRPDDRYFGGAPTRAAIGGGGPNMAGVVTGVILDEVLREVLRGRGGGWGGGAWGGGGSWPGGGGGWGGGGGGGGDGDGGGGGDGGFHTGGSF